MKITVTLLDIVAGQPGIADRCPVALAVRRAAGVSDSDGYITVESDLISLWQFEPDGEDATEVWSVFMPESVGNFVAWYDENEQGDPFEFDLDIPAVTP